MGQHNATLMERVIDNSSISKVYNDRVLCTYDEQLAVPVTFRFDNEIANTCYDMLWRLTLTQKDAVRIHYYNSTIYAIQYTDSNHITSSSKITPTSWGFATIKKNV